MRDEYNIDDLNPRKNPYASRLKKQITINLDCSTIAYFKAMAEHVGIPYQTLINLYLEIAPITTDSFKCPGSKASI